MLTAIVWLAGFLVVALVNSCQSMCNHLIDKPKNTDNVVTLLVTAVIAILLTVKVNS